MAEAPEEPSPAVPPHITLVVDGSARGGQHFYGRGQQPAGDGADDEKRAAEDDGSGKPTTEASQPSGQPTGANATYIVEDAPSSYFSWGVWASSYFKKWRGGLDTPMPAQSWADLFWSWLGAFLGILAVAALNQWVTPEIDIALMVGSFGASAVLVFGVLESKLAQPRNFVGGQLLSALVGMTVRVVIHKPWIAAPVAMSLSLTAMQLTRTTHPPGGATALIAASMSELPKWHGYSYLVTIGIGSVVMQLIALFVNNLAPHRRYPTYWW